MRFVIYSTPSLTVQTRMGMSNTRENLQVGQCPVVVDEPRINGRCTRRRTRSSACASTLDVYISKHWDVEAVGASRRVFTCFANLTIQNVSDKNSGRGHGIGQ